MLLPSQVQKGDAALLLVAAKLSEAGLIVLQPLCEALPFDLGVLYGGHLYRIQVKRACKLKRFVGRYLVSLRKISHRDSRGKIRIFRYTKEHTDFIAGVVVDQMCVYLFPIEDVCHMTGITLDPDGCSPYGALRKIEPETYRDRIVLNNQEIPLIKTDHDKVKPKIIWPSEAELYQMRQTMSFRGIARTLGCSYAAVYHKMNKRDRRRCGELA